MAGHEPENLVAGSSGSLDAIRGEDTRKAGRGRYQVAGRAVLDCRRRKSGRHPVVSLLCLEAIRHGRDRSLVVSRHASFPCCAFIVRVRISLAASLGLGTQPGLYVIGDSERVDESNRFRIPCVPFRIHRHYRPVRHLSI